MSARDFTPVVDACVAHWSVGDEDARRLFHGRGHMYPGLEDFVVNWFPPFLQVALYSPVASSDLERLVDALLHANKGFPQASIEGLTVQFRDGRATRSEIHFGQVPEEIVVTEAGLKYYVYPLRNQNIGLFMDMAHVRKALAPDVAGKRVLNLFAYTCAFSVSALAHGAEMVVNNDMSRSALEQGARNHALNGHDARRVRMLPHNLFKSWWKIRQLGPYDVVIIDPPTSQRGSFVAQKSYGQVLKRLSSFTTPGATVMVCLNSPFLGVDFLTDQMQQHCPNAILKRRLPLHPDFPDRYPDKALKVLEYTYEP